MSQNDSPIPSQVRDALNEDSAGEVDQPESDRTWEALWTLLGRAAPPDEALPDAEEIWSAVEAELDDGHEPRRDAASTRPAHSRTSRSRAQRRLWRWGPVGAIALVLLLVGWWWTQPAEVVAPPGTTVTRTLPDGTTVELNGDTQLTYPWNYWTLSVLQTDRRVVRLEGEAYFDVPERDRPFIVQTNAVRVEVLGTTFTVQSRSTDDEEVHVALIDGQLRVTDRARPDTSVMLRPGQATKRSHSRALTPARDTSLQRVTAWRRGGFAVTDRTLPSLADALERRFGQRVRLHPSIDEPARAKPLTLYYPQAASLEPILRDVCMARGLTYRATANGYVLTDGRDSDSPDSP